MLCQARIAGMLGRCPSVITGWIGRNTGCGLGATGVRSGPWALPPRRAPAPIMGMGRVQLSVYPLDLKGSIRDD